MPTFNFCANCGCNTINSNIYKCISCGKIQCNICKKTERLGGLIGGIKESCINCNNDINLIGEISCD